MKTLNTTKYKAKTAAKKFYEYLRDEHEAGDHLHLFDPEQSIARGYGNNWTVCWEGGPFEWAYNVGGWGNIYEGGKDVLKVMGDKSWCEPYTSYALCFYDN